MHKTVWMVATAVLLLSSLEVDAAESAKSLLNQGNKLFSTGDYQAAYEAFEKGNEKQPLPVFLRSMGYALLKMYRHTEAQKLLQEYLKESPKATDKAKIDEVLAGLEVVVQTRVTIQSTPSGATLYFDAKAAGKVGTTPFSGTIEPGKHTVILEQAGYRTATRTFTIKPKETLPPLRIPLEVPFQVTSTPPGASVHLDAEASPPLGTTPYEGGITPGAHTLFLKKTDFLTLKRQLKVKAGAPLTVAEKLQVEVQLASVPSGAMVEIDGAKVEGATPVSTGLLPGKHTMTITLPGFKPLTLELEVKEGEKNVLHATLVGGLLSMRTDVSGATVAVENRPVGQTPVEKVQVPLGTHAVTVTHADRKPWSKALDFDEGQVVDAEVKLARPLWPVWVSAGVALAGMVVGTVGAALAYGQRDELTDNKAQRRYTTIGDTDQCMDNNLGKPGPCPYGIHHMSTAGFVVGGTAAATGLLYYLIWGRPDQTIKHVPSSQAASARPRQSVN